jgi:hypothetical protein
MLKALLEETPESLASVLGSDDCELSLSSDFLKISWGPKSGSTADVLNLLNHPDKFRNSFFPENYSLIKQLLDAPDLAVQILGRGSRRGVFIKTHRPIDAKTQGAPQAIDAPGGLPRFWRLFSYLLPRKTRDRVFEPNYQELLEDYLTRGKYRTKWAKRWLAFCFTFRTILMVLGCFRAMLADKAIALLARLVPEPLKRWWLSR